MERAGAWLVRWGQAKGRKARQNHLLSHFLVDTPTTFLCNMPRFVWLGTTSAQCFFVDKSVQPPGHNLCPGVAGWAQRRFPSLCNASLLPLVWRPAQCCPEGIFDHFFITYLNKRYLLKNTLFQVIGGVVHLAGVFIVIVLLLLVHLAGVFKLSPLLQTSVAIPSLNLTRY